MLKFTFFFILFLLIGGFMLHSEVVFPSLFTWVGNFPGDIAFDFLDMKVYCPFSTAALSSFFCSVFFAVIS